MKNTLTLKKPATGEPAQKAHPLAAFVGHKVVVQILRSPGRIEGFAESFELGWLRLTSARIIGTKNAATPQDGVILVAREEVGHIHREAVVTKLQGGAV